MKVLMGYVETYIRWENGKTAAWLSCSAAAGGGSAVLVAAGCAAAALAVWRGFVLISDFFIFCSRRCVAVTCLQCIAYCLLLINRDIYLAIPQQ